MNVLRLIFPYVCPVCRTPVAGGRYKVHDICRKTRIYVTDPYCMKCGRPMKEDQEYCEQCLGTEFPYEAGRCVFLYHSQMGQSIAEFKNKGFSEVPCFFAEMAMKYHEGFIKATGATMIIPVPISHKKERIRGFNQSERLAYALSERAGIPLKKMVIKVKDTVEQKQLGRKDRQRNLQDCFRVKGKCYEKAVIVVDDIFTTGSTIAAVATALKKSGVERVYFICAASAHS